MIFRWLRGDRGHLSHEELSTYVDGGPDALSEASVNAHLAECDATCAAQLKALRATVTILRSVEPVEAPRSFALTPEMVADLPDGKPLGSPQPMRGVGLRLPVWAPAIGAAAAAVVFALVLVGNLTGSIEQSSSSGHEATAGATSFDAAAASTVQEMAVEAQVESALAPPSALGADGDANLRTAGEGAISTAESEVTAAGEPGVAGETTLEERVASLAAPAEAPQPELESAGESLFDATEAPAEEALKLEVAPEESALQRSVGEARQTTPVQLAESDGDDFTLPVWQVLLGTGLAALALAVISFVAARRQQLF